MMRLLKIARSGLAARPASEEEDRKDERESEGVDDAPLEVAAEDEVRDETDDAGSSDDNSDELESDIGAILAMIRSRKAGDIVPGDLREETGATYRLLSELDRIWRSA